MSNQYKEQLQNLSEQIFEIREKCTDQEYKNLMETLKDLYEKQDDQPNNQPVFHQPNSSRPQLEALDNDGWVPVPQGRPIVEPLDQSIIHTSNAPQNQWQNVTQQYKHKNVVHKGIICDHCSKGPIVGIRYNCQDCTENYDLCQACFDTHKTTRIHKHTHFGAVVKPQEFNTDCCTIM